jgi:hypothetical protein
MNHLEALQQLAFNQRSDGVREHQLYQIPSTQATINVYAIKVDKSTAAT